MKTKKTNLLFLLIAFLLSNYVLSQQKIDSVYYYYNLTLNSSKIEDFTNAYNYYSKQKEQYLSNGDTLNAVYNLRFLAIIQLRIGDDENEATAVEALKLLDNYKGERPTLEPKVGIYNHLGKVYRALEKYDDAIYYYGRALEIVTDSININIIQNNIAYANHKRGRYDLAIKIYKEVYQNSLKTNDKKQIARALTNLGLSQSKLNLSEGQENMEKALKVREELGYQYGVFSSYIDLAIHFKDKEDKEKTKFYINKALKLATISRNVNLKQEALSMLMELHDDKDVIEYKRNSDSIAKVKQALKNKFIGIKYSYNDEQKKRKQAELENAKAKTQSILFFSITVLVILVAAFLFYILKTRHKKNTLKKQFETEQRISKKLHDEVANDVYSMMSRLENDPNIEKEFIDNLEDVYLKTRDISKANAALDVSENFDELLGDLIVSYKNSDVNIFTRNISKVSWNSLSDLKKETLYRVIQELMTNMRKHSKASLVTIQFEEKRNKFHILYKDNGIGCDLKQGSGLRNTENRMELAGGTITFESETDAGFQAKLRI